MALSKERVLDRLELLSKYQHVSLPDAWTKETAESAIALINSTDVAEVEKLRAENLAMREQREDAGVTSLSKKELCDEVEKLKARVLELQNERDQLRRGILGEPAGFVSRQTNDVLPRFCKERPTFNTDTKHWMNMAGSVPVEIGIRDAVGPFGCVPVYFGAALNPNG